MRRWETSCPARHVVAVHSQSPLDHSRPSLRTLVEPVQEKRAHDYAVYLFDAGGRIGSWYGGAERLYGYTAADMVGQSVTAVCSDESAPVKLDGELEEAAG